MLDDLRQRMSAVLQKYGVNPRDLSQEQLYKLALTLLQHQGKTGTPPQLGNKPKQKKKNSQFRKYRNIIIPTISSIFYLVFV